METKLETKRLNAIRLKFVRFEKKCACCGNFFRFEKMWHVRRRGVKNIGQHEMVLCQHMAEQLQRCSNIHVYCGKAQSGVLSVVVESIDCESVGEQLAKRGIAVRTVLQCAPTAHETAGTLEHGTVRMSFSAFNSLTQMDCVVQEINRIVC